MVYVDISGDRLVVDRLGDKLVADSMGDNMSDRLVVDTIMRYVSGRWIGRWMVDSIGR